MPEETIHVWFCSPDAGFAEVIALALGPGYAVRQSEDFHLGAAPAQEDWGDVVLLDLQAVGSDSDPGVVFPWTRFMEEIHQVEPPPPIIAMLADDDPAVTRKVMENGVYDTVTSPPNMIELRLIIRRAHKFHQMEKQLCQWRSLESSAGQLCELIGYSEAMQRLFALARKIASCDVNVLVTGETGTGKELMARAIHRLSPRAAGPFLGFSCANLPESLIEDELFGHEKGAFTGAIAGRRGRFEAADHGTMFLDEVGDLALGLQAKLLRVLQERSFERLGSNLPLVVNIRLICATHQDLAEMVKQGKFREDLYYRLNVIQIHLPPLRERREEIPSLAYHFLQRFAQQFGKKTGRFSPLALHAMEEYNWPGNVRELENIVQRALVMAEASTIELWHLPSKVRNGFEQSARGLEQPGRARSYEEEVRDFKRRLILRTLRECGGQKTETARTLGLARGYLHRLIHQLQIDAEEVAGETPLEDRPPGRLM